MSTQLDPTRRSDVKNGPQAGRTLNFEQKMVNRSPVWKNSIEENLGRDLEDDKGIMRIQRIPKQQVDRWLSG